MTPAVYVGAAVVALGVGRRVRDPGGRQAEAAAEQPVLEPAFEQAA